ncbi:MAG: precorrin-6y C5,15-methyltransferase (decarboxylating) subunit CbiE, partial [Oscillospiraceae bacterium]|nr:precorrin-6y C5,15-methyltransferase (decarboxylating) subunit CbiE [Oscillospiraceae bacterium]
MDKKNNKLYIIGGGSGNSDYLLPVAKKILKNTDRIIAPARFQEMLKNLDLKLDLKIEILRNIPEFLEQLPERLQSEQIAVLVSGDPLYYSLCRTILERYPNVETEIIPGIGSLQLLGTAFGITMEDAAVLSLHGRICSPGKIAMTIAEHPVTFFFCSADHGARQIAEILSNYQNNLKNLTFYVGSDLGCPKQKLNSGAPEDFLQIQNPALHVVAVKNSAPRPISRPALLPDDAFLRNQSPMTKEEVRAVILNKLKLHPDHVIWDIGAGTGSISVECARFCPFGNVYA